MNSAPQITVSIRTAAESFDVASALFGLAAAQLGASVAELQRGDIALAELIDATADIGVITSIRLKRLDRTFTLTLSYSCAVDVDALPKGTQQIVDAGFGVWRLTANEVNIALSAADRSADHG